MTIFLPRNSYMLEMFCTLTGEFVPKTMPDGLPKEYKSPWEAEADFAALEKMGIFAQLTPGVSEPVRDAELITT